MGIFCTGHATANSSSSRPRFSNGGMRRSLYNNELLVPSICYLDGFSGVSGDMLVGALADAGADQELLTHSLDALGTGACLTFEKVKRRGIAATKFHVEAPDERKHRHLPHILRMIDSADLPEPVKQNAAAVFQRLGEAEAAVHAMPIEKVHFHEVGAVDSIIDIVGACIGFELLGIRTLISAPLNLGSGTVQTEHGILPVPAPATSALLIGKPVYSSGPAMELTTPTGAAVVSTLAAGFGVMPPMKVERAGYGAGSADTKEQANVLRILVGEPSGAAEATTVSVIEANIDDLSPQVLGFAVERLLEKGALDVTLQPLQMKKGRPGILLRVLAEPENRETLAQLVFAETSTLGVRMYTAERRVQARNWEEIETRYGKIRVKVGANGHFAPEYEDCRRAALEFGVPLKQIMTEAGHVYLSKTK
jgi:pyridinium-3,5-bisthiocarboxylic acid mononucleotide nickel chelatase